MIEGSGASGDTNMETLDTLDHGLKGFSLKHSLITCPPVRKVKLPCPLNCNLNSVAARTSRVTDSDAELADVGFTLRLDLVMTVRCRC